MIDDRAIGSKRLSNARANEVKQPAAQQMPGSYEQKEESKFSPLDTTALSLLISEKPRWALSVDQVLRCTDLHSRYVFEVLCKVGAFAVVLQLATSGFIPVQVRLQRCRCVRCRTHAQLVSECSSQGRVSNPHLRLSISTLLPFCLAKVAV